MGQVNPERPAVLVQLGSGNNFGYGPLRRLLVDRLLARPGLQVVMAEWLMADRTTEETPGVTLLRRFPLCRYVRAFDASVSAPGYNTFHEVIAAGLPTAFVPNENPHQDDQLARARFAERRGIGWCVRTGEPYRLLATLDRLLDPEEQARVRAAARGFRRENGAIEAAHLVAEPADIRRGMRVPAPTPETAGDLSGERPAWGTGARRADLSERPAGS
jgi:UDP:flavonoid glycosyltransferase YjiC (YdhE family)